MIGNTSLQITEQYKRWQLEMDERHARRNKIRYIDYLLNELELLNLSEAGRMPRDLGGEVRAFISDNRHAAGGRSPSDMSIAESMEALYDIQDTLLPGSGEEDEEP